MGLWALLFGVEGVLGVVEKLVLKLEAFGVGFDGFEGGGDLAGPLFLIEFAEFFGGGFALAGVVIGEAGVPPDACLLYTSRCV